MHRQTLTPPGTGDGTGDHTGRHRIYGTGRYGGVLR